MGSAVSVQADVGTSPRGGGSLCQSQIFGLSYFIQVAKVVHGDPCGETSGVPWFGGRLARRKGELRQKHPEVRDTGLLLGVRIIP